MSGLFGPKKRAHGGLLFRSRRRRNFVTRPRVRQEKTLSKQIARNRSSLARLAARGDENSIGYNIVREFLEKKEKELSKIQKCNGGEPNKQINLRGDKPEDEKIK